MCRTLLPFVVLAYAWNLLPADESDARDGNPGQASVSDRPGSQAGPPLSALARSSKEMNPGNPIQNYFKCFMEQQKFFFDKEAFEHREKLLAMPLKELSAQELADYGGLRSEAGRLGGPARSIPTGKFC